MKKICSICKEEYVGFGNNAYPFKGRCCDTCDSLKVIPARISAHFSKLGKKSWVKRRQMILDKGKKVL